MIFSASGKLSQDLINISFMIFSISQQDITPRLCQGDEKKIEKD